MLYQGDKLLVFGDEKEHRTYLSGLTDFDLKTAHWTQPQVLGPNITLAGHLINHKNFVLHSDPRFEA
jgi:hypothetical protein